MSIIGRRRLFFMSASVLLLVAVVLSILIGPEDLPVSAILKSLLNRLPGVDFQVPYKYEKIVINYRLPVVLTALFVGGGLAVSGASLQGLFQNPLVDPYIIGISAGGAFGYVLGSIITVDIQSIFVSRALIILLTFSISLVTVFLAYFLSRTGGKVSISHLLLAGIALSAFLTSITQILAYFFIDNPKVVIISLLGSCSNLTWAEVAVVVAVTSICSAILMLFGRDLNAFSSGEDSAKRLGVEVETSKFLILGLSTLIASVTIPFCGIIGFVGLIIPHVVRVFLGPDHRWLLPGSVLCGGAFLVFCDLFARTIIRPYQIPVGIVTGVVGGMFFIYLISVKRRWRR